MKRLLPALVLLGACGGASTEPTPQRVRRMTSTTVQNVVGYSNGQASSSSQAGLFALAFHDGAEADARVVRLVVNAVEARSDCQQGFRLFVIAPDGRRFQIPITHCINADSFRLYLSDYDVLDAIDQPACRLCVAPGDASATEWRLLVEPSPSGAIGATTVRVFATLTYSYMALDPLPL